ATDRAIVNNLSTAMQSRLIHFVMEVSFTEWLEDVAIKDNYDSRLIAFLSMYPKYLMDFRPDHQEKTFCCPRTWEFMNKLIMDEEIVDEDAPLFAGTIKENLAFVAPNATEEDMLMALTKASCSNILDKGGSGLATLIGEGGLKLSGGEKQRLSIARALLRHPHLLIFDEATSSLDSITEESITDTIRQLSAEREQITIMIAHRLSTIIHATRIYVLEKGQVIEKGTHDSLLSEKGLYYAMWRQQIGERRMAN
ncbi:MAG: hypothetical protein RIT41_1662, partial [Bacteroidota bacterium]